MSALNYSKWDNIEVSDDEDDTHPNIDTPSLFKWRHEARVQRMEEQKQKEDKLKKEKQAAEKELAQKQALLEKAKTMETNTAGIKVDDLAKELKNVEKKNKELDKASEDFEKEKKEAAVERGHPVQAGFRSQLYQQIQIPMGARKGSHGGRKVREDGGVY